MGLVRTGLRLLGVLTITGGLELLWLLGHLPACALGRGEPWRRGVFRTWARWILVLLAVRVEVVGAAPSPPFFLVSNHLSYLDIVVFARETGAVFVAKSEVSAWPVVGWLARSMGTVFVNREEQRDVVRVGEEIAGAIARGRGLILFPEGTSTSGRDVASFRPSLLAPAARGEWEVHHASIRYVTAAADPPARLAVAWWGDMTFGRHFLELLSLRRIEARIVFGEGPLRDPDRKSLARRLHGAISATFEPLAH